MPGGRKKNIKKRQLNRNESALLNSWKRFIEAQSEASGAFQEAFVKGDFDRLPHSEQLKEIYDDVEARAEHEVSQDILKKQISRKPMVSYEETDQTPLSGNARRLLRAKWASGMDYAPHRPNNNFSHWAQALYSGDHEGVLEMVGGKTEEEVRKLLSMRESLLNVCAVFHVVQGARALNSDAPELVEDNRLCRANLNVKNEHIKILHTLISLGADVNVRDVAGFTPLHHCVQLYGNDVTLQMAEILIKAGAEVDAKNRFGETPLMDCTLSNKLEFVSLLLKHGANPSSKDNDGCSPQDLVVFNPRIRTMFGNAERLQAILERRQLKESAGGSLSACLVCRASSDTKKCSGCFSVWFCGTECQRAAWPDHQRECQEIRAQYCTVRLTPEVMVSANHINGKFYLTDKSGPTKQHFVVKIQLNLNAKRKPIKGNPMMIYDKERTFSFLLKKEFNKAVFPKLERIIMERGVEGLKGFFHAIVPPASASANQDGLVKVEINLENILPRQTW